MQCSTLELGQFNEPEMQQLARDIGQQLRAGDTVLLRGSVGAGKTSFARALIQDILIDIEDVPSPTFTLVQTYDTRNGPLWHCDLYRLGSVFEVEELGLSEAFETSICLVEWPEILGELAPPAALTLQFTSADDARTITASFSNLRWPKVLAR